jgi:hypothetical protein
VNPAEVLDPREHSEGPGVRVVHLGTMAGSRSLSPPVQGPPHQRDRAPPLTLSASRAWGTRRRCGHCTSATARVTAGWLVPSPPRPGRGIIPR